MRDCGEAVGGTIIRAGAGEGKILPGSSQRLRELRDFFGLTGRGRRRSPPGLGPGVLKKWRCGMVDAVISAPMGLDPAIAIDIVLMVLTLSGSGRGRAMTANENERRQIMDL